MKLEKFTVVLTFVVLTGCTGAHIGINKDVGNVVTAVGTTTYNDIVKSAGLPQKSFMLPNGDRVVIYENSSRLTGACIGCGIASAPVGLVPAVVTESLAQRGVAFFFDKQEVLKEVVRPK